MTAGTLIPATTLQGAEEFRRIPLEQLVPHPANRKYMPAATLKSLAESLKETGQLTACLVRLTDDVKRPYQILAGERRWRSAKPAGLPSLLCRVIECDDAHALRYLATENKDREDPHPLDDCALYQAMLAAAGMTVALVADIVGQSETWVYARLQLAKLSEAAKKAFYADQLLIGHALLMARLHEKDQGAVLQRLESGRRGDRWQGITTVAELRAYVEREILCELSTAPFKQADATLWPAAGPCTVCPKRTGLTPELFADLEPSKKQHDRCLDPQCFEQKVQLQIARVKTDLTERHPGKAVLELTESYHVKEKGLLPSGAWREVKRTDPKAQPAIICEGHHRGQVKYVSTEKPKASTSEDRRYDKQQERWQAQQRRAQQKAKEEASRRRRILTALRPKLATVLGISDLQAIVEGYACEMQWEPRKRLLAELGFEPVKASNLGGSDSLKPLVKYAAGLTAPALCQLLLLMTLFTESHGLRTRDPLAAMAKRYKVDVAAIDRAIAKEAGEKKKAKKMKKAAATKPARGRAKAKKKAGTK